MNVKQRELEMLAMMKQVFVNRDIIVPRTSHGFPPDHVVREYPSIRLDQPRIYFRVVITVIELRDCFRESVLVLQIVLSYYVHQRATIRMINQHVPRACT